MTDLTPSPTSNSYFSQRMRLHYLDWGNASAPHVLLVHGMRDHGHNWDWVARELCTGHHVVAPDLRGHGDSEWPLGGSYSNVDYVYDLAQLVQQARITPCTLIAHSLGGTLACLYAGLYPEQIERLVVIEGVGLHRYWQRYMAEHAVDPAVPPAAQRMRQWVDNTRQLAGRQPKRYATLEEAYQRMQLTNPHLTPERARHLTVHGSTQNEDGTFSWKFDNYTHARAPYDFPDDDVIALWQRIRCPVLLLNSRNGYGHRIGQDDTAQYFADVEVDVIEDAGHWTHHDQPDAVLARIRQFMAR